MTTSQEYNEEIKRLESLITSKQAQADSLNKSGQAWIDDAYKTRNCKGTKKQKDACNAENQRKTNLGNQYLNQARGLIAQIASHNSRIAELRELSKQAALTDSEVSKILAGQGKTTEAIKIFAEKQGDAEFEKQKLIAQAESNAVAEKTETNKKATYVIMGVVALAVIAVVAMLIKKLRKK